MTKITTCYGMVVEWAWLRCEFVVFDVFTIKTHRRKYGQAKRRKRGEGKQDV